MHNVENELKLEIILIIYPQVYNYGNIVIMLMYTYIMHAKQACSLAVYTPAPVLSMVTFS